METTKNTNWLLILNLSLKIILIVSFVIALTADLEVLAGKGMPLRAPFFVGSAFILPIIHIFKKWEKYPHAADALIVLPPILDTLGNLFGLFDSVVLFDDIIHALNWVFFIMAFHALRFRKVSDTRDAFIIGGGMGAILIIIWEIVEWIVAENGFNIVNGLHLTLNDTIGDLFLSTLGGFLGSYLGIKLFSRNSE